MTRTNSLEIIGRVGRRYRKACHNHTVAAKSRLKRVVIIALYSIDTTVKGVCLTRTDSLQVVGRIGRSHCKMRNNYAVATVSVLQHIIIDTLLSVGISIECISLSLTDRLVIIHGIYRINGKNRNNFHVAACAVKVAECIGIGSWLGIYRSPSVGRIRFAFADCARVVGR